MSEHRKHIVLQTTDLEIGYTKNSIAKNISITVQQGELVGVIGSNGIGKSTLLRTLSGAQIPLNGNIEINSKKLDAYTAKTLSKVLSLVLTEPLQQSNLSVYELVALGRQPHTNWIGIITDNDKTHIKDALEKTELTALQHKKCFELSDGERQKALIARAIAQDTPLVLLDEPTSHLDLYHKALTFKLLHSLAKEHHKTLLFSCHDINTTLQVCDKLLVLTTHTVHYDTPKNLIEANVLDTLFPNNLINFDKNNRTLRLNIRK